MDKKNIPHVAANDDEFGSVLICAVRYCLGRATYMPHLVMDFITPFIPYLENRTLYVMIRDIQESHSLGMECDRQAWMSFLQKLHQERQKRGMCNGDLDETNP